MAMAMWNCHSPDVNLHSPDVSLEKLVNVHFTYLQEFVPHSYAENWKLGRVLYWTFLCWEPNLNRTFFLYVQKPEKNCWELNLRNMRNCYAARPEKLRKNMKLDKHVAAPEKHAAGHFWILKIIHVVSKILMCLVMYLVNCNSNTTNSYRFHPDGMYLVIHTGFILMKCIL
jgi:hypothetical protein